MCDDQKNFPQEVDDNPIPQIAIETDFGKSYLESHCVEQTANMT